MEWKHLGSLNPLQGLSTRKRVQREYVLWLSHQLRAGWAFNFYSLRLQHAWDHGQIDTHTSASERLMLCLQPSTEKLTRSCPKWIPWKSKEIKFRALDSESIYIILDLKGPFSTKLVGSDSGKHFTTSSGGLQFLSFMIPVVGSREERLICLEPVPHRTPQLPF